MSSTFRESINGILGRLSEQKTIYDIVPESDRSEMRYRALVVAYTTAHTTSPVAAQNLHKGFIMESGRKAVERRFPLPPREWDQNQRYPADPERPDRPGRIKWRWATYTAKARFARALCGYSLGPDAVCLDLHMLRLPIPKRPRNAYQQWAKWFRAYRNQYGEESARWCLDWHRRLLDHIALVPNVYIGE